MEIFSSDNGDAKVKSKIYKIDGDLKDFLNSPNSMEKKLKNKYGNVTPLFLSSDFTKPQPTHLFQSSDTNRFRNIDNV